MEVYEDFNFGLKKKVFFPTIIPRVFLVETKWEQSGKKNPKVETKWEQTCPSRFNMKYMWCVCKVILTHTDTCFLKWKRNLEMKKENVMLFWEILKIIRKSWKAYRTFRSKKTNFDCLNGLRILIKTEFTICNY